MLTTSRPLTVPPWTNSTQRSSFSRDAYRRGTGFLGCQADV